LTSVTAISGLGGKTPACFLVETGTARFLLDLGEGPAPGQFPDLAQVGPVDAILISHGHADHIGGLHLALELGNPTIFATAMTRTFAGHPALKKAHLLPLRGEIEICGVRVETGRAGHAAGAVWIRIGGETGVLYTGDICRESLLYPVDEPLAARVLIADASYGEYDEDIDHAVVGLIDKARRAPLLLPLPPTGRGVEIAVLLHEVGLPVSICAQHRHVATLMARADGQALVDNGRQRIEAMLASAGRLSELDEPQGVMIAANGAATSGVSAALLQRFLNNASVEILLTGHVDNGTPANAAIAAGRAQVMRWNVHPRRRDIAWLHETVRPQTTFYAFCDSHAAEGLKRAFG
jgi:Cft2 family RNA processing exonuclease